MQDTATIEVSWPIAVALRAEAQRLGISEEEVARLAWEEHVSNHRGQLIWGFIKRLWLLLRPGAKELLARAF